MRAIVAAIPFALVLALLSSPAEARRHGAKPHKTPDHRHHDRDAGARAE